MIVDLYKKHCYGDTCKSSTTAENFIMYKIREIKIEKKWRLGKFFNENKPDKQKINECKWIILIHSVWELA